MSKFWIKLYHEILDDPKMGKMPDRLWRRTVEFFLLAGKVDQEGELPSVDEICWMLRISNEECNETLHTLQRMGIVHCNDGETWIITHFAERQRASTSTERSRAFREKTRQKPQLNVAQPETKMQRNVAPELDIDIDKSERRNAHSQKKNNSEKTLSDNRQFGIKLTEICGYSSPEFVVNGRLDDCAQAVTQLLAWGATISDLDSFARWWWGKTPPNFKQVVDEWGKFKAAGGQPETGNGYTPPPLDDARRQAYLELQAETEQAQAESAARAAAVMAGGIKAAGVDVQKEIKKVQRRLK